jgi:hypothetical protein
MMKLTEDDIRARVIDAEFFHVDGTTTTLCLLKTISDFVVTGTSACIDPAEFDAAVGRELAYKDALRQLWSLEGYRVSCAAHDAKIAQQSIAAAEKTSIITP